MTKSNHKLEREIFNAMPRSLQIFCKIKEEAEREMREENRARNKTARKKTKKKRGGV
jgi:hypothetical protein